MRFRSCLAAAAVIGLTSGTFASSTSSANRRQTDQAIRDELAALKEQVKTILTRIDALEQAQAGGPATAPTAQATNLPNISTIFDGKAVFGSDRSVRERGKLEADEFELAIQSGVYPNVNFNGFISMEKDDAGGGFNAAVEEAYFDVVKFGNTNFGMRGGVLRTPIGKFNPLHTHTRYFADVPLVIRNLFGEDGMIGNGAELSYLFPLRNAYLTAEVGQFTRSEGDHIAIDGAMQTARALFAPAINDTNELELGLSGVMGKATPTNGGGGPNVNVVGADITYRRYLPQPFRRILVQGEYYRHQFDDPSGSVNRDGFYAALSYRKDRFWEYGVRFDQSQRAFAGDFAVDAGSGHDRSVQAWMTYFLTEQSFLRLQLGQHHYLDGDDQWDALLQFSFGFGPHGHNLQ